MQTNKKTLRKKEQPSKESQARRNAKTSTYEQKVDLATLPIASQARIFEFIKSQKAYFENKASGVIKTHSAEVSARQNGSPPAGVAQASSTREDSVSTKLARSQQQKHQLREPQLRSLNKELGQVVEEGSIQLFDCPPILYSPPESDIGTEPIHNKHFDLPTSYVRSHEQDSVLGSEIKHSSKLNIFYKIYKMSKLERQKLQEVAKLRDKNQIVEKNIKTALTFGKKIEREKVNREDYLNDFKDFYTNYYDQIREKEAQMAAQRSRRVARQTRESSLELPRSSLDVTMKLQQMNKMMKTMIASAPYQDSSNQVTQLLQRGITRKLSNDKKGSDGQSTPLCRANDRKESTVSWNQNIVAGNFKAWHTAEKRSSETFLNKSEHSDRLSTRRSQLKQSQYQQRQTATPEPVITKAHLNRKYMIRRHKHLKAIKEVAGQQHVVANHGPSIRPLSSNSASINNCHASPNDSLNFGKNPVEGGVQWYVNQKKRVSGHDDELVVNDSESASISGGDGDTILTSVSKKHMRIVNNASLEGGLSGRGHPIQAMTIKLTDRATKDDQSLYSSEQIPVQSISVINGMTSSPISASMVAQDQEPQMMGSGLPYTGKPRLHDPQVGDSQAEEPQIVPSQLESNSVVKSSYFSNIEALARQSFDQRSKPELSVFERASQMQEKPSEEQPAATLKKGGHRENEQEKLRKLMTLMTSAETTEAGGKSTISVDKSQEEKLISLMQSHNQHSAMKLKNMKAQTDKSLLKQKAFVEKHIQRHRVGVELSKFATWDSRGSTQIQLNPDNSFYFQSGRLQKMAETSGGRDMNRQIHEVPVANKWASTTKGMGTTTSQGAATLDNSSVSPQHPPLFGNLQQMHLISKDLANSRSRLLPGANHILAPLSSSTTTSRIIRHNQMFNTLQQQQSKRGGLGGGADDGIYINQSGETIQQPSEALSSVTNSNCSRVRGRGAKTRAISQQQIGHSRHYHPQQSQFLMTQTLEGNMYKQVGDKDDGLLISQVAAKSVYNNKIDIKLKNSGSYSLRQIKKLRGDTYRNGGKSPALSHTTIDPTTPGGFSNDVQQLAPQYGPPTKKSRQDQLENVYVNKECKKMLLELQDRYSELQQRLYSGPAFESFTTGSSLRNQFKNSSSVRRMINNRRPGNNNQSTSQQMLSKNVI